MTTDTELTIGKVAERFIHALNAEERAHVQGELQRFLRWYGPERSLAGLSPHELEAYSSGTVSNAIDGRRRLEAVRAFLAYAKQAGLTKTNLSVHVRIAGLGGREKGPTESVGKVVRLSKEGFDKLELELETLRDRRPGLAEQLKLAMEDKDFRENAPLDAAREEQAKVEARIREIEGTLRHAVVIQHMEDANATSAQVGVTVRLRDTTSGRESSYRLVERTEVDPSAGKISIDSPVGKAVNGCRRGDTVEVATPGGARTFVVEAIEG